MKRLPCATGSSRLRFLRSLNRLISRSSSGTVMGTEREVFRKSVRARFSCHSSIGFVAEGVAGLIVSVSFMRGTSFRPFSISRASVGGSESNGRILYFAFGFERILLGFCFQFLQVNNWGSFLIVSKKSLSITKISPACEAKSLFIQIQFPPVPKEISDNVFDLWEGARKNCCFGKINMAPNHKMIPEFRRKL